MAQAFTSGSPHTWFAIGRTGQPRYIGTPERAPRQSLRPQYENVTNTLAGEKLPFDLVYSGTDALITFDLTRWNAVALNIFKAFPNPDGGLMGTDEDLERGTLMLTEDKAIQCWISHPRSALPSMNTLVAGYHFIACVMEGVDMEPSIKPYKERIILHAIPVYDPESRKFVLFDTDMSGLPDPD